MLTQFHVSRKRTPGNMGTTGDGIAQQLLFAATIVVFLSMFPANATPVEAHDAPTTCSVSINKTTKYKQIFVGHVRDGETVFYKQNGVEKQIYRGHTYTNRAETVSVTIGRGGTEICSG